MTQEDFDLHVTRVRVALAEVAAFIPSLYNDWPMLKAELTVYAKLHDLNTSCLGEH